LHFVKNVAASVWFPSFDFVAVFIDSLTQIDQQYYNDMRCNYTNGYNTQMEAVFAAMNVKNASWLD
jgi:hypothetical protein